MTYERPPRPIGISLLAIFRVVGGVVVASMWRDSIIAMIGGIHIAVGVGLWMGARWAWWLEAYLNVGWLSSNVLALALQDDHGVNSTYDIQVHVTRILGYSLLLAYIFNMKSVLTYFGLGALNKFKAVFKILLAHVVVEALQVLVVVGSEFAKRQVQ